MLMKRRNDGLWLADQHPVVSPKRLLRFHQTWRRLSSEQSHRGRYSAPSHFIIGSGPSAKSHFETFLGCEVYAGHLPAERGVGLSGFRLSRAGAEVCNSCSVCAEPVFSREISLRSSLCSCKYMVTVFPEAYDRDYEE